MYFKSYHYPQCLFVVLLSRIKAMAVIENTVSNSFSQANVSTYILSLVRTKSECNIRYPHRLAISLSAAESTNKCAHVNLTKLISKLNLF